MSKTSIPFALAMVGMFVCRFGSWSYGLPIIAIAALWGVVSWLVSPSASSQSPSKKKPPPERRPRLTAGFTFGAKARAFPVRIKFDASSSSVGSGSIVEYRWDFGDGSSRTSEDRPLTTHSYGGPGSYTVRLTVKDAAGRTAEATETVEIGDVLRSPGEVWASAGPGSVEIGWEEVPEATSYSLYWSTEPQIATRGGHREEAVESPCTIEGLTPGTRYYFVVCSVDRFGEADPVTEVSAVPFSEQQPPVAAFTVKPKTGTAPLEVRFDARKSRDPDGRIAAYIWDFGDGAQTDTGLVPTARHTYAKPGRYDVQLTVVDNQGARGTHSTVLRVRKAASPKPPEPPEPPPVPPPEPPKPAEPPPPPVQPPPEPPKPPEPPPPPVQPPPEPPEPPEPPPPPVLPPPEPPMPPEPPPPPVQPPPEPPKPPEPPPPPPEPPKPPEPPPPPVQPPPEPPKPSEPPPPPVQPPPEPPKPPEPPPPPVQPPPEPPPGPPSGGIAEPSAIASRIDGTVATQFATATEFLYRGAQPVQLQVQPDAIDSRRVAVLRGRVFDPSGAPLPDVRIRVQGEPTLGFTFTRASGQFDLAVNGGSRLTVVYERSGFLPVHRFVQVPWLDYAWLDDVVLLAVDGNATSIQLKDSPQPQVARGAEVSDASGKRQATLLFSSGTQAEMVLPDGSTRPLTSLSVRATEYTVGAKGPHAMPAPLPAGVGYTYAVELSVDEALAAGASHVRFDRPVIKYVENFLGFPVGTPVPVGYYDRERAAWIPEEDGRVIHVTAVRDGVAELDVEGTGAPSGAQALGALGIMDAERRQIAGLYAAGQQLWRVPLRHFSPIDFNWPIRPPPDARPPDQPPPEKDDPEDEPCERSGSIVDVHNQALGEVFPISGTPFSLCYRSDRVPGRLAERTVALSLSGPSVPASLSRVELEIQAGGDRAIHAFPPAPDQRFTFTWDGKDAYQRAFQGEVNARFIVRHVYPAEYLVPPAVARSFGRALPVPVASNGRRAELEQEQQWALTLKCTDQRPLGLGGWRLDIHHSYDPVARVLHLGTGERRDGRDLNEIRVMAGGGALERERAEGRPAQEAKLFNPDFAIAPDGSLWITDGAVHRVTPDGLLRTLPASRDTLADARHLAFAPDGSCFFLTYSAVYRLARDGCVTRYAGGGEPADGLGDDGPALDAALIDPAAIAVDPDGRLWILDFDTRGRDVDRYTGRARVVGHDGVIHTAIGGGRSAEALMEGRLALEVTLNGASDLTVGPDGSVYLAEDCRVRRVGPDGRIHTVIGMTGWEEALDDTDGLPATQATLNPFSVTFDGAGRMLVVDNFTSWLQIVDTEGIIHTLPQRPGEITEGFSYGKLWPARGGGFFLTTTNRYNTSRILVIELGPDLRQRAVVADLKSEEDRYFTRCVVTPDGVIYATTSEMYERADRLERLEPGGRATVVAGATAEGPGQEIERLDGLTVGPDGSVYFCDGARLWRLSPDGKLATVPGADGSGTTFHLSCLIAVGGDGSLYVLDPSRPLRDDDDEAEDRPEDAWFSRLSRIRPNGEVTLLGGGGKAPTVTEDGTTAQVLHLRSAEGLAFGPNGEVYFQEFDRIRTVGADGRIATVAGVEREAYSQPTEELDGVPATEARFDGLSAFCVGPDGTLYLAEGRGVFAVGADRRVRPVSGSELGSGTGRYSAIVKAPDGALYGAIGERIVQVGKLFPGVSLVDEIAICDESGGQLFVFDRDGRHLRTVETLTGATLYSFEYDHHGRLSAITEGQGRTTTLERDGAGNLVACVSPHGLRTLLPLSPEGFLAGITSPTGASLRFEYAPGGLLTRLTDPMGNASRYEYDPQGRLIRDEDADGCFLALSREKGANGTEIAVTQPSGRQTRYPLEKKPSATPGSALTGAVVQMELGASPDRMLSYPDGTTMARVDQPDPQLGPQHPIMAQSLIRTPSGLTTRMSRTRSVKLADPAKPLSVESITETVEVNGAKEVTEINVRGREVIHTSAAGRRTRTVLDDAFRVLRYEVDGLEPMIREYGPDGRALRVSRGAYTATYRYDNAGRPLSITDASGESPRCEYDAFGRLVRTVDGDAVVEHTLNANGQLVALSLPGSATHEFTYSPAGRATKYTAPGRAPRETTYDADGQIARITLPSGRRIDYGADESGQPCRISHADATVDITYGGTGTGVSRMSRTPSGGGPVELFALATDGSLVTELTVSGTTSARFRYRYDADHRLAGMTLEGRPEIAFEYDPDDLPTRVGPFSLAHDGPAGACNRLSDGTLTVELEHDRAGRLVRRRHSVRGKEVYEVALEYGPTGLVLRRTERIAGKSRIHQYTYDPRGQVTGARLDGRSVEEYAYDLRGNRVLRRAGDSETPARYAPDDALLELSGEPVEVDPDGFVQRRGALRLRYSVQGELLEATGPGGTVSYALDPTGRRVARADADGQSRYLYGRVDRPLELTAMIDPAGELTVFHYGDEGQLLALERKDGWYYVATDQVGSPRVICDAAGQVVKVLEYDTFGRLLTDSAPAFALPIGFAGGLADARTGLLRFGERDYDPETGRWTAKDPVMFEGGDLNLYRYAMNNPVRFTDPNGMTPISFFINGNMPLLYRWIFEQGPQELHYGHGSPEAGDMARSYAASRMRRAYVDGGCKSSTRPQASWRTLPIPFTQQEIPIGSTPAAALETLFSFENSTQAQVGAFTYEYRNVGQGYVMYTITNYLTINSFFYHVADIPNLLLQPFGKQVDVNRKRGDPGLPYMGTVKQVFSWIEPNPCGCKKKNYFGIMG